MPFKKEVKWAQLKTCPCGPLFSFPNFSKYVLMIKKVWCDEGAWMHGCTKPVLFLPFLSSFFYIYIVFLLATTTPLGASMHLANIPVMFSLHKYTFLPNIFNYQLSVKTFTTHLWKPKWYIFYQIKRNTKILKTMSISLVASSIMESSCIKIFNRIRVDWQR